MFQESPSVSLYRDYWSNRRCLGRNIQDEGVGWINPDKYTIDVLSPEEIIVERKEDGSVTISELNGKSRFTGLINPLDFINQYEPQNILIRKRGYGRTALLSQTPQEWHRLGVVLDTKIGGDPVDIEPPLVVKEELVSSMSSDLKRLSFWNPLISYPLSYILVWLINKFIYNFIFEVLIPWLKPIHMPFLILIYLGLTYSFITRILEEMGTDVMKSFKNILLYDGEQADTKHYRYEGDIPSWLESKPYWVFRYLYLWRGELKVKKGFPPIQFELDWERIDVWIDARTGIVEWIITDYHWRELWYKAERELNRIYVWVVPNFHTIMPLNIKLEKDQRLKDLYDRDHPVNITWRNHLRNITGAPEFEGESDRPRWLKRLGRARAGSFLLLLFSFLFLVKGPGILSNSDREQIVEVSAEMTYKSHRDFFNPNLRPKRDIIFVANFVDDRVFIFREREIRICSPISFQEIKKTKLDQGTAFYYFYIKFKGGFLSNARVEVIKNRIGKTGEKEERSGLIIIFTKKSGEWYGKEGRYRGFEI